MAHSRFARTTMFDWIEQCIDAAQPTPGDAAICERFGFESTESARTLLAELADAGRISIKGYGEMRTIALGRQRSAYAPAARPLPSITKADPEVERGAARLIEIARRHAPPAAAVRATNAAKLLDTVTAKPAAKTRTPAVQEKPAMPAKSVCLPASAASAIAAMEAHARSSGLSLGAAAAELIERGTDRAIVASSDVAFAATDLSIDELFEQLRGRIAAASDQSSEGEAANARADAAEARATAAETQAAAVEGKLTRLKEALAA